MPAPDPKDYPALVKIWDHRPRAYARFAMGWKRDRNAALMLSGLVIWIPPLFLMMCFPCLVYVALKRRRVLRIADRVRSFKLHACPGCLYDLRNTNNDTPCPECGFHAPGVDHREAWRDAFRVLKI